MIKLNTFSRLLQNKLNTKNGSEVRTKTFEEKEADYIKAKNRIFNNNPKTNESIAPDMSNETSAPDTNTHQPSSSSHQYTILNRQNSNKTPNPKPHHHPQPPAQNTSNQFNKINKNKNPNYPNNNAKQSNYANGAATKRVSPNLAQTSTSNMPLVAQQAQQAQQTAHYTPNQVVYTQPYSLVQHHPANVQLNSPMSSQTGYQQVIAAAQGQFHQDNLISSSQTPPTPQSQQATPQPGYFILAHPSYQNQNVPQPMQLANPASYNPNQGNF